ncbi:PLP-dependent aspartate aminotransferase family protein [Streptomyces sp. SID3343]|uniref:trans-sulfuration enzyme family protein n=1 Tax=Streptomyces sp. SID3343 TaxID=2690260 RepID=UPI00136ABFF9|nr:PLP-dependent aspartate aminotransferase family protein [Streptomyces sp. SID3343]MYW02863.1 PLP-dependent transferase [Streptomyces sp. SID3343]
MDPRNHSAPTARHTFETRAVHAGRDDLAALGTHAVPIDLSTTYPLTDLPGAALALDAYAEGELPSGSPIYGRLTNPTVRRFEEALAELEGCEAAVAFASGMAAVTASLLAAATRGKRHVVAVRPLYGTTDHLLTSGLLGTEVTWVTSGGVAAALRPETGLVMVETPANPTLAELDLADLAAQAGDVPLLVDNTFATPVLQRPAEFGARMVLHSATKFLGGHGDVMGGVVACDEESARVLRQIRFATGALLHPLAGYMLLRGLATLPVRVMKASTSAGTIATRLAAHPGVERVHYPSIGGALIAFEVAGDPMEVVAALRLITPAVSLGGTDSLIQHPASLTHRVIDDSARAEGEIGPKLLRLSVGLEHEDDLWADLAVALAASAEGGSDDPEAARAADPTPKPRQVLARAGG